METNRLLGRLSGPALAVAGLFAATVLAGTAPAQATEPPEPDSHTFRITGQELTGETRTVDGDGSVRVVVKAGVNGLLEDLDEHERVLAAALARMSVTVNDDVLEEATLQYTQHGAHPVTVTVQIDPCWFEFVNDREATAQEFGADLVRRIEEQAPPGTLEPCIKEWLAQRFSLLGAKIAEPYVRHGIILVPPRS